MVFSGIKEHGKFRVIDEYKGFTNFLSRFKDGTKFRVDIDKEKYRRTPTQNDSLHLYYEHLAEALNDGGYSVKIVLQHKLDADWNKELVKELLWRPMQKVRTGKESTTELDKQLDITDIWEHLNRFTGEKFGVHVPFPSAEEIGAISNHPSA